MPDPISEQPKAPQEAPDPQPGNNPQPGNDSAPTCDHYFPPETNKNKKIVVCCDGTGNEFATRDADNSNSNVVKLYTALRLDGEQFAYYHPGVGTMGDPTKTGIMRKLSVLTGLGFGRGFRDNVLDAYRYLMQHYNSGDKVYIFGFSRGAYTARALAGLLHGYGLLCRGNESHIPYAWRMYTQRVADQQDRHTIPTDFSFRDTFSHRDFIMDFVGLWDTVSSVGWIASPLRLLHLAQNPSILRGRHAVSIDERRTFYQDNLWGLPTDLQIPSCRRFWPGEAKPEKQDIVQVWFSGVHSDVGGSYPQLTSGLSNITLQWMLNEAKSAGLNIDPAKVAALGLDPKTYGGINVDPDREKMVLGLNFNAASADPHGQLAGIYEHPRPAEPHNSLTPGWWPLEIFPHRYYDRDDSRPKMRIPLGSRRRLPDGAIVHPSVYERLDKVPCYRPTNLDKSELQPLLSLCDPTSAHLDGFYVFQPKLCRDGGLRENPVVVFLVTLLETALGIWLLVGLLRCLAHVGIWLSHMLSHLLHGARPMPDFAVDTRRYHFLLTHLQAVMSPQVAATLHKTWPLVPAFLLVVGTGIVRMIRRGK